MEYRQEPPFKIELDLVEGCFMKCKFCALWGLPEGFNNYHYMSKATLEEICVKIKEAGWNSRIVLAGHGEPMKHPHIVECIKTIRTRLPKNTIALITNGFNLTVDMAKKLFKAGLSNIAISEYTNFPQIKQIKAELKKEFNVTDWEDDKYIGNPTHLVSKITVSPPFEFEKKNSSHRIVNRCGVAEPGSHEKQNTRCGKPFRDMYISYDGTLVICCQDFRRSLKLPNIFDDSIDNLWNCKELQAIRRILYTDKRQIYPCNICDHPAYRVGLLPDKMGKVELDKPTEEDYQICKHAILKTPMSGYKPRPWEPEEYNRKTYLKEIKLKGDK